MRTIVAFPLLVSLCVAAGPGLAAGVRSDVAEVGKGPALAGGQPGKGGKPGMPGCDGGARPAPDGKFHRPGTHRECNPSDTDLKRFKPLPQAL